MSTRDIRAFTTKERSELDSERFFLMQTFASLLRRVADCLDRHCELAMTVREIDQIETSQGVSQ